MKIKLKNTPEHVALVKAMADKDPIKSAEAKTAFAQVISMVMQQVLDLAALAPNLYTDWPYSGDSDPEIPLDLFYNSQVGTVTVWQQSIAGGLGSSLVTGLQTQRFSTYNLDSAVSLLARNVERGELPYVSLALNRTAQEILRIQERNAFLVALRALGEASTNSNKHVIAAATANRFQIHDFNKLKTRSKRINVAFNNGTPDEAFSRGCTDMLLSPEMMEEVRGFAYQPMNTVGVPNSDEATAVPLPDAARLAILNSGGAQSIYDVMLHEANEFGVNQPYNDLFDAYDTGINGPGGAAFASGTDELVLAWDATREAILRPVNTNAENGGTVTTEVDDSFTKRSGKIGWFLKLTEGRLVIDARALMGVVV